MAKTKTITFVLPALGAGGAESVMITLANNLVLKYNVYFVVGLLEGEFKDLLSPKITIKNLNVKRFSSAVIPLSIFLRKIRPDAVLSTLIYTNIITTLSFKLSGIKGRLILREATTPSKVLKQKSWIFNVLYKWAYNYTTKIIAVSQGVKDDMISNIGISPNKIEVVGNPIISDDIKRKSEENLEHRFIQDKKPLLVTVGKVSEAKDYTTLLRSFKILNEMVDCNLLIVGNTNVDLKLYAGLIEIVYGNNQEDKVDFVGYNSNPFSYMKQATVFVLSSIREGLPGALIQALYLNGNVVSTDCESGPKEILANGKYGRLVPIKDPDKLAKAMYEAITAPYDFKDIDLLKRYKVDATCNEYSNLLVH
jgi:glycosyltransferase involved in cell wall biosynthesis